MKSDFIQYFRETFFHGDEAKTLEFIANLTAPKPRTLRTNIRRIDDESLVQGLSASGERILRPTHIPHMWESVIARPDAGALGSTWQHLSGRLYIQELSASRSVHTLQEDDTQTQEPLVILDMAASPGGKTTQLAETYPRSIIVANEPGKERMSALIENTERMGSHNIAVSNHDGRAFLRLEECFDRVLLDAPCSGEGIAYKAQETLDYWNIKNVKTIAALQKRLIRAAITTLKTGGTMVYSTCTLNAEENEGVLEYAKECFGEAITILSAKRVWPHEEAGWGFFVAKIQKNAPTPNPREGTKETSLAANKELGALTGHEKNIALDTLESLGWDTRGIELFRHRATVLAMVYNARSSELIRQCYFLRFGQIIGTLKMGRMVPHGSLGNDTLTNVPKRTLTPEEQEKWFMGFDLPIQTTEEAHAKYVQIAIEGHNIWLAAVDANRGSLRNDWPREWKRK